MLALEQQKMPPGGMWSQRPWSWTLDTAMEIARDKALDEAHGHWTHSKGMGRSAECCMAACMAALVHAAPNWGHEGLAAVQPCNFPTALAVLHHGCRLAYSTTGADLLPHLPTCSVAKYPHSQTAFHATPSRPASPAMRGAARKHGHTYLRSV